jgi:UDP-N-acetyl-2-amino-2-deoxyglucuronate dehydrogenase
MDGQEIEFSEGFTELHTALYADILAGGGFGLADAKPSVALVYAIRSAEVVRPSAAHPYLENASRAQPAPAITLPPPRR